MIPGKQLRPIVLTAVLLLVGLRSVAAQSPSPESSSRSEPSLSRWIVSAEPIFDSQDRSGDTAILYSVRGATRLLNGSVVVGDPGAKDLKWFGVDGRLVARTGRQGSGPGEFEFVDLVGSCGSDSVFVFDRGNQRLTTFSSDGELVDTRVFFTDQAKTSSPSVIECGFSKRFGVIGRRRGPLPQGNVAFRQQVAISIQSIDGAEIVPVGTVPSAERHRFGGSIGPRPLGKETTIAIGADRIYVGTGDSPLIAVKTLTGARLPSIQLPFTPQNISSSDVDAYIERLFDINPTLPESMIRSVYEPIEYPERFPSHGDLLVDAANRLWVEQYRRPGDVTSDWMIFSKSGKPIAEIELPANFRAEEAGADYVLGSWKDQDDVLHVRMYEIVRP